MKKLTFISDTHTREQLITPDLPGGDFLFHSGDIMNSGYNPQDIENFCSWFDSLSNYKYKIFIVGNHCRLFEDKPEQALEIVNKYKNIIYLQDSFVVLDGIKIYGSPWQPEFYNWAFNLPRNGFGLASKWEMIPKDTDILLTHGPAYGYVDTVKGREYDHLGCELLQDKILQIQPKIHSCGHIHSGYGYVSNKTTHFFNASVLYEDYNYSQKPWNVEWDKKTNILNIL